MNVMAEEHVLKSFLFCAMFSLMVGVGTVFAIVECVELMRRDRQELSECKAAEGVSVRYIGSTDRRRSTEQNKSRVIKNDKGRIILVGRREGSSIVWRDTNGKIQAVEAK